VKAAATAASAIAAALALLPACDVPPDGVLSFAFILEPPPPSETRSYPSPADTGLPPFAFAGARGRCDGDIPARRLRCTFSGLPPAPPATPDTPQPAPFPYQLSLLVGYGPLTPRFDGRALDRDPGGRDPDAPPPPLIEPLPRVRVGPVLPDPFGAAARTLDNSDLPLDHVVGGELELLRTRATGETVRLVIIDGRVGNLPADVATAGTPTPPAGGGHVH
jgi:hypothetical protein